MEAEQAPSPSSSAPSSSSSAPSSSSSITDSVPTSSSPLSTVAPTPSPSFSTTPISATTTTMATSTATSDTTATVTTTTTTMIDIPPILGATATTTTSTGETNSLTSTSFSSSTTAPTAATTVSTTTTTITTSPFSTFDHQPSSNALPLRPSFPINRNRPQMPPPHFAQHLPSPSPPPLPFSSSSPDSSSSVGVPSLLASSSLSSSSLSSSSSSSSPSPPPPPPSATSPSSSSSPLQRGGLAIGVPAFPPRPQSTSLLPSSTFGSPRFGHQLGSLGRISDQTQSASPQVRPGIQGIQTIGMMGALSGSQIHPGAAAAHLPPRPAQQQLRPQSPSSNQPSAPQKQQGPGLSRVPSFGPGNSQPPSMPHSPQSHTQPWMSTQGRSVPASVLSSASYRPQFRSSVLQQRSTNTQQQQNPMAVAPQQQQQNVSSQQQQQQQQQPQQQQQQQPQQNTSQMQHAAENCPQMHQPSRMHPVLQPQQGLRPQGSLQKSIASPSVPSAHHGSFASTKASEAVETGNQILSKRNIHELLAQIDPLERLDPEVDDVLAEIADDFVESITTFACSLAKHRKSTTLEAKDILLHMERNWNTTLPGFSADEIKIFKKPPVNDIHKQRMVAIKKSYITTQAMAETANVKGSSGQVPGNVKGHPGKGPAMTSPKT